MLCKQGVVGSSPIVSTDKNQVRDDSTRIVRSLEVGEAVGILAGGNVLVMRRGTRRGVPDSGHPGPGHGTTPQGLAGMRLRNHRMRNEAR